MATNRGLGKGLSALFLETEDDYGKSLLFDEPEGTTEKDVTEIDITSIFANPNQPRKVFDQGELVNLAISIRMNGILQPITVRQTDKGYELVSGERRLRASKLAGLTMVPVVVKEYTTDKDGNPITLWKNEKDGEGNDKFASFNGNIIVTSNKKGVTVKCSNSDTLLKDTEWFRNNREMPDSWKNAA